VIYTVRDRSGYPVVMGNPGTLWTADRVAGAAVIGVVVLGALVLLKKRKPKRGKR